MADPTPSATLEELCGEGGHAAHHHDGQVVRCLCGLVPHPEAVAEPTPSAPTREFPCLPSLGEHCGQCHRCTDPTPSAPTCDHPNHGNDDHDCTPFLPCANPSCHCRPSVPVETEPTDALVERCYQALTTEAAVWQEEFDAGPGLVIGAMDAAVIAARLVREASA